MDGSKWLVTAKHILFSCEKNGLPFTRINVMFSSTKPWVYLPIPFREMRKYGKIHVNEKVDIAIIKINQMLEGRYNVQTEYNNFEFFDDSIITDHIPKGDDSVSVTGYPEKDINWNKTSLKRLDGKVIACPTKDKVRARDHADHNPSIDYCFCIDKPVEKGMSGSPVISISDDNSKCKLAGICIARLENDDGSIGGAAIPSHYIRDIIDHGRDLASYLDQFEFG